MSANQEIIGPDDRLPMTPAALAGRTSTSWSTKFRLLLGVLLLVLLGGCQLSLEPTPPPQPMPEVVRGEHETVWLSLFLNLKHSDVPGVIVEISDLEVQADDAWLPLTAGPQRLDSEAIAAGQLFLGSRAMAPGRYHSLRFRVDKFLLRQAGDDNDPLVTEPFSVELELPTTLRLADNDSRSLFITWDVQESLERQNGLHLVMSIAPQIKQMLADLVYVACPEINTIYVIRSDKNWVADSFGIRGRPTHLSLRPEAGGHRLYVLAADDNAIKVVDLASQRIIETLYISRTENPTFMTISPDGNWAYILEEQKNYLNRIDLATGRNVIRTLLAPRPHFATYLENPDLLAVSSGLSQEVSLHHPLQLTEVSTIRTGIAPRGLLFSDNLLYVAESGNHMVNIVDFATRRSRDRLNVGLGPHRLLATKDYIYVSNRESGSLSVMHPEPPVVIREIRDLEGPGEIIYEPGHNWLYVGEEHRGGLAVIDPAANRLVDRINLGARPLGLAVIP